MYFAEVSEAEICGDLVASLGSQLITETPWYKVSLEKLIFT
jgi:uncharacterized membrane protein